MSHTPQLSAASPAGAAARWRIEPWHISCALALLTLLVFLRALTCGFVKYDDDTYVLHNRYLLEGWTASGFWHAFWDKKLDLWHPGTTISLQIDAGLFHKDAWGYHLHNLLLHVANVVLLFAFLRRATGDLWRSAMAAAVFGIHPLRVESVVWVVERKDVLSTFYLLLTLLAYLRYIRRPAWSMLLLMFATLGMSLLCKPMYVTLPVFLLILDFWPLRRWQIASLPDADQPADAVTPPLARRPITALVLEKIPFFLIIGLVAWQTIAGFAAGEYKAIQQSAGDFAAAGADDPGDPGSARLPEDFSLSSGTRNALVCYVRYVGKIFWFGNLAAIYPEVNWPWPLAIAAGILLLCCTLMLARHWRRHPWLLAGWLWFLVILSPVNNMHKFGPFSMADRYTYFASVGIVVAVLWSIPNRWFLTPEARRAWTTMAAVVLLVLGISTIHNVGYWKDGETLFRHAIDASDPNYMAHYNLGLALGEQARHDEAERQFRIVVSLRPDFKDGHENLADALSYQAIAAQEQWATLAQRLSKEELAHDPDALAATQRQQRLDQEAVEQYAWTIRNNPQKVDVLVLMMGPLLRLHQPENALAFGLEARRRYKKLAEEHGGQVPQRVPLMLVYMGEAYRQLGRLDDAEQSFRRALNLDPDNVDARHQLAYMLSQHKPATTHP